MCLHLCLFSGLHHVQNNKTVHLLSLYDYKNITGMEAASYLSDKAASVTLVGATSFPFERSLGPEIGKMTMQVTSFSCPWLNLEINTFL